MLVNSRPLTYLTTLAESVLLATALHFTWFWWNSVRWLGFPIIGVLNSPLLADLGVNTLFAIPRALFICVFNANWFKIGLVWTYWLQEYVWVVMGVILEDSHGDVHWKMEREEMQQELNDSCKAQ